MTELVWKAAPVQISRWRLSTAIVFVSTVLTVLTLPPALYAWLSYVKFGLFKPTYYVPHEAFLQTMRTGSLHDIWDASLVVVNMTSGLLLSNLYALTVGQLVLSLLLGIAIALNVSTLIAVRRACSTGPQAGRAAGAAGTSLFATVAASSTGIFGCCGGAAAGGVLALAGVSSTTAIQIGQWSPYIQVLLITLFLLNYLRLRGPTHTGV
jgi:hypothetical protein